MFKHEPATVDALAVETMSPIRVYPLEFAAAPALFRVVVRLIMGIDCSTTAVAPNNEKVTRLWVDFAAHFRMALPFGVLRSSFKRRTRRSRSCARLTQDLDDF